jgi:hypothetical protein
MTWLHVYLSVFVFFRPFTFNGHTLRTMKIAGEPWLVAVDVLRALDVLKDPLKGITTQLVNLDAAEKRVESVITLKSSVGKSGRGSGSRPTTLISESGFYKITMRAQRKNPSARASNISSPYRHHLTPPPHAPKPTPIGPNSPHTGTTFPAPSRCSP